jgi:hypothetical protein
MTTLQTLPLLAAAVAAVIYLCRIGIRAFRRFLQVADVILGHDDQPSLSGRLSLIEHELHPNSGLSLRDSVDRTEAVAVEAKTIAIATQREMRKNSAEAKRRRAEDRELLIRLLGAVKNSQP